jgi:type I restriction enzyme M protein
MEDRDDQLSIGCIVLNGSPLFSGDANSGESNIRRWILENDYLEALIQLPDSEFFNTNITTYIWVLNKNKREALKNKVKLIDASVVSKQYENLSFLF